MDETVRRKIQLTEIEILDEIVRLCDKHNITYFLIGGTLLGAIRHKGFIPWDDDLDIVMPRDDYDKFKKVASKELCKAYVFHDYETESNHYLSHAKIRKNNTVFEEIHLSNLDIHKGIFVDIFILDNAKKQDSLFQYLQAFLAKSLGSLIWNKIVVKSFTEKTLEEKIKLAIASLFNLRKLQTLQQRVMASNRNNNSKYYVNIGSHYSYRKQTIPKNKYYTPVKVEFEGKFYNAPRDWDYILTRLFGDYMQIPAEDQRETHNPLRIKFDSTSTLES